VFHYGEPCEEFHVVVTGRQIVGSVTDRARKGD
jgi:hypothetical protein